MLTSAGIAGLFSQIAGLPISTQPPHSGHQILERQNFSLTDPFCGKLELSVLNLNLSDTSEQSQTIFEG